MRRVSLDVRRVAGDVGNRKKFAQLPDDAVFIGHAIVAHFPRDCAGVGGAGFCASAVHGNNTPSNAIIFFFQTNPPRNALAASAG